MPTSVTTTNPMLFLRNRTLEPSQSQQIIKKTEAALDLAKQTLQDSKGAHITVSAAVHYAVKNLQDRLGSLKTLPTETLPEEHPAPPQETYQNVLQDCIKAAEVMTDLLQDSWMEIVAMMSKREAVADNTPIPVPEQDLLNMRNLVEVNVSIARILHRQMVRTLDVPGMLASQRYLDEARHLHQDFTSQLGLPFASNLCR